MINPNLVRFDEPTDTLWLIRPDPLSEKQLDIDHDRLPGQLRWRVRRKNLLQKIVSVVQSVASGFAPDEIVSARKLSCFGDSANGIPQCSNMVVRPTGKYCGTCSCGQWLLSNLQGDIVPKLKWAVLNCPLRRPGFTNSV